MTSKSSNSDNTVCPACGKTVKITQGGVLAQHDRTPDPLDGAEQKAEHCRWSGENVDLIVS